MRGVHTADAGANKTLAILLDAWCRTRRGTVRVELPDVELPDVQLKAS